MESSRLWPGLDAILLPRVSASRCVHSHAEAASCRACVERCPTGAWVIDDACLGIDPARCDGCGLCAAVCPEGAIAEPAAPAVYSVDGVGVAFAVCTRAGLGAGADDLGTELLPCLHVLGIGALLALYRSGVRELVLCRGGCQDCPRGRGPSVDERLHQVQQLLRDRGLDAIRVAELGREPWLASRRAAQARHQRPQMGRRAFFRGMLTEAADRALDFASRAEAERPNFVPPGRLLERPDSSRLSLHAPRIDAQRCIGCDACARLCPHDVIRVDASAYRFDPDGCTGCGLCTDVCASGAVSVSSPDPSPPRQLPLRSGRCPACGLVFHLPRPNLDLEGILCPICAVTRHHERLFQVER